MLEFYLNAIIRGENHSIDDFQSIYEMIKEAESEGVITFANRRGIISPRESAELNKYHLWRQHVPILDCFNYELHERPVPGFRKEFGRQVDDGEGGRNIILKRHKFADSLINGTAQHGYQFYVKNDLVFEVFKRSSRFNSNGELAFFRPRKLYLQRK